MRRYINMINIANARSLLGQRTGFRFSKLNFSHSPLHACNGQNNMIVLLTNKIVRLINYGTPIPSCPLSVHAQHTTKLLKHGLQTIFKRLRFSKSVTCIVSQNKCGFSSRIRLIFRSAAAKKVRLSRISRLAAEFFFSTGV